MSNFFVHEDILVSEDVWPLLRRARLSSFNQFMDFHGGERVVHKRGRSVFRLELEGRTFYLKRNFLHWVEFFKNLSQGRWPKLGARVEWENILALKKIGIPTVIPVAMGDCFRFGIETASFTFTEQIYGAEALNVCLLRDYSGPKSVCCIRTFRQLIQKMADLTKRLHAAGMNHQDLYLNHFFVGEDGRLYLIDLQRVQRRQKVPMRYLVKDLAQLCYSADFYKVGSRTDRMRFFMAYLDKTSLDDKEKSLARLVTKKVRRIAKHDVKLMARRRRRGELA